jgi:ribosomal protein S18 acetylase RimI-like enzyme
MGALTPPRPLAASDDREVFDCGRDSLNLWFRRHAWRNQEAGTSRTSVICDDSSGAVAGFVSIAAGQIERAFLPKLAQRNRPDPIPVILLGQLAVDRGYQGRGCARSLVRYAFGVAMRLSRDIGCFGLLTHPLDDEVRNLYRRFGFDDLPFDPGRSMLVRIIDLERSGF